MRGEPPQLPAGRELIASRGQLVEIGGSFRLPEVVQREPYGESVVDVRANVRVDDDFFCGALSRRRIVGLRVDRRTEQKTKREPSGDQAHAATF